MKWTKLLGTGVMLVVTASQVALAEDAVMLKEQARTMELNQQRLEQRFQQRSEAAGSQYRYENRVRQRSSGNQGYGYNYEEQAQSRSSGKGGRH